jgi:biotin carboxyl carrier protein
VILELEVGGATRTVEVGRVGDRWRVKLDGQEVTASVTETDGVWSLLLDSLSYEVTIEEHGAGRLTVHMDGQAVAVGMIGPRAARSRRTRGTGAVPRDGPMPVTAPMPGRVVKVLVSPGHAVVEGQGLVVVEAMKMENELRAPRAGTVREVHAAEGQSIEANAVLVVVE